MEIHLRGNSTSSKGPRAGVDPRSGGIDGRIKTVRTVTGEDDADLPMAAGAVLTVAMPDDVNAGTDDLTGETTTKPQVPAVVARMQELSRKSGNRRKRPTRRIRWPTKGCPART